MKVRLPLMSREALESEADVSGKEIGVSYISNFPTSK